MALEDIKGLKVPAAKDCVLFLWATATKLHDALEVMRAWGFTYVSSLVWVKRRIGLGYYVRNRHELALVGTRGRPNIPQRANRPPSVSYARTGTQHNVLR